MARAKRTNRQAEQRLSWQQRHTIRVEADRILEQQDNLRNEIRGSMRFL